MAISLLCYASDGKRNLLPAHENKCLSENALSLSTLQHATSKKERQIGVGEGEQEQDGRETSWGVYVSIWGGRLRTIALTPSKHLLASSVL